MIIHNWRKCYTIDEALEIAYKDTVEDAEEFVKLLMERQKQNDTKLKQEQYV